MKKWLRDYFAMELDGMNPFETYEAFKKEGKQRLECLRDVRLKFDMTITEAKEVMIVCETDSKSLHEHQGKLAETLFGIDLEENE